MARRPSGTDCGTTGSFADHGVEDGSVLIRRTYYRLREAGYDVFEPTDAFFEALVDAFRDAFRETTGRPIPDDVAAALDDALIAVAAEFDGSEADLRTDVVPAFYREAAGYHCAYRTMPSTDEPADA